MPLFLDAYVRLEPVSPAGDLDGGFAARLADPAWFLGRQWQLGEHRGEDAGSPVLVEYDVALTPLNDPRNRDAVHAPTEALVEAAATQWWTPARRVRKGRRLRELAAGDPGMAERLEAADVALTDLPPPYDFLNGHSPDGLALYLRRAALGLPADWFADLPPEAALPANDDDGWDPASFHFDATLEAGAVELRIERHDGGRVDWYSCDARPRSGGEAPTRETGTALPSRLRYAGAPAARWWQLEERQFDVGGFPPDRSHFATLLLIDLMSSHADNWFLVPVDTTTPALGHLLAVEDLRVFDSFGQTYHLSSPADGWRLFEVDGLGSTWSLPLLPAASSPLLGSPLDEVEISLDEDSDLVWAHEHRLAGRATGSPEPLATPVGTPGGATDAQRYDPNSPLAPYWHPYILVRDLRVDDLRLDPAPPVTLTPGDPVHLELWVAADIDTRWRVSAGRSGATGPATEFSLPATDGRALRIPLRVPGGEAAWDLVTVEVLRSDTGQRIWHSDVPADIRWAIVYPNRRRVVGIRRRAGTITHVCLEGEEGRAMRLDRVIAGIDAGRLALFVAAPDGSAEQAVQVRRHFTTAPDERTANNLDALPECTERYRRPTDASATRRVTSARRDRSGSIESLCNDREGWAVPAEEALAEVVSGARQYYLEDGASRQPLLARVYLTTAPDSSTENNVEALPPC